MGIKLTSNFDENVGLPLDSREIATDNTARDAIANGVRYIGLNVFIVATNKTWQLQGGISNSNWVDITSSFTGLWQTSPTLGSAWISPVATNVGLDLGNNGVSINGVFGILSDAFGGGGQLFQGNYTQLPNIYLSLDWVVRGLYASDGTTKVLDWSSNGGIATALPITSTVATGTPPFYISSLTEVTNLNAGMWQGQFYPMSALGDLFIGGLAGASSSLPGNATTVHKFLRSVGTGTLPQLPSWEQIDYTELSGLPTLAHTIASVSHKFLNSYDATTGNFTALQPAYSDISGTPDLSAYITLGSLSATSPISYNNSTGVFSITPSTNLSSLQGLTYASAAFVKMTGANTFTLDTNTYLTSVTAHNVLSATHGDTLTDTVVAGDIMIGNATPKWARLAKGTDGYVLTIDSSTHLPAWKVASGGSQTPWTSDIDGAGYELDNVGQLNPTTTQTTENGNSGTMKWSMPFQGSSYKKFLAYLDALTVTSGNSDAVNMNGSGYIEIPNSSPLAVSNITISFWIKPSSQPTSNTVINKSFSSTIGGSWLFSYDNSNGGQLRFIAIIGGVLKIVTSGVITSGSWHHVVGTYDGSTVVMYLDGSSTGTPVSVSGTLDTSTNNIEIGRYSDLGGYNFSGAMDELNIWNRALSSSDVTALYNSGAGVYGDTSASPYNSGFVAGYHFDEGSGTTIADFTTNANTGNFGGSGNTWVNGLITNPNAGGITVTFPTAFTKTPFSYGNKASLSTITTTTLTINSASADTGWIFVEGY